MKYFKPIIFFILLLRFNFSVAQNKDTLYLLLKKDYERVIRLEFKNWIGINDTDNINKNEIIYYKVTKSKKKSEQSDLYYDFTFFNQKSTLYKEKDRPPLKLYKNKCFLKEIKSKTIPMSKIVELDYLEVLEKYRNDNYVFFLIDEADFKGRKIIIREVIIVFP